MNRGCGKIPKRKYFQLTCRLRQVRVTNVRGFRWRRDVWRWELREAVCNYLAGYS